MFQVYDTNQYGKEIFFIRKFCECEDRQNWHLQYDSEATCFFANMSVCHVI